MQWLQADGGAVLFLLYVHTTELYPCSPCSLRCREAGVNEMLSVGVNMELQLSLNLGVGARAMNESAPPRSKLGPNLGKKDHICSGVAHRTVLTTSVICDHFSISVLSWREPLA